MFVAVRAIAAENDAGFDNADAVRMGGFKARGAAQNTIDIFDPSAGNALYVVMVISDACFVTGAGRVRWVDAADQSFAGKVLHDLMHGLG